MIRNFRSEVTFIWIYFVIIFAFVLEANRANIDLQQFNYQYSSTFKWLMSKPGSQVNQKYFHNSLRTLARRYDQKSLFNCSYCDWTGETGFVVFVWIWIASSPTADVSILWLVKLFESAFRASWCFENIQVVYSFSKKENNKINDIYYLSVVFNN